MGYSLALGPFHPAWRGPQRFILQIEGERVADLEYRDGYNERGCAERLPRLELPQALFLVSRICGTCSIAHTLAFCQALESLCGIAVGERALLLRTAAAEVERAASHLAGAATLLETIGLDTQAAVLRDLRETTQRVMLRVTGSRIAPDFCVPGGVKRAVGAKDREEALLALPKLARTLFRTAESMIEDRALLARTVDIGSLPRSAAEQYGVRGPMARASGMGRDTRADHAYAGYTLVPFRLVTQEGGDLYARLLVLVLEAYEALKLADLALQEANTGAWQGEYPAALKRGSGTSVVEAPRGTVRYTVESDGTQLSNVRIDTPRQLDRLLARTLLVGALLDNVIPIIASCDTCMACAEQ